MTSGRSCKRARVIINPEVGGGGSGVGNFTTLTVTGVSDLQGAVDIGDALDVVDNITSTTGNIVAQSGTLSSSGNITSTAGNIVASAGTVSASANITSTAGNIIATLGDISAPAGDIDAVTGTITGLNVTATSVVSGFIVNSTTAMNTGSLAATGAVSGSSVTANTGDVSATLGDIVSDAGDLNATVGDVNALVGQVNALTVQTAGNITTTGGNFVATTGDVNVTAGDVNLTAGDVALNGPTACVDMVGSEARILFTTTNVLAGITDIRRCTFAAASPTNRLGMGTGEIEDTDVIQLNELTADPSATNGRLYYADGSLTDTGVNSLRLHIDGTGPARDITLYAQELWTPVLGDAAGDFTMVVQNGFWTRIGNTVWANCDCSYSGFGGAGAGILLLQGLPFITATAGVFWGELHAMDITGAVDVNEVLRVRNSGTTGNWHFIKSNLATGVQTIQSTGSLETGTDDFRCSMVFQTSTAWPSL